MSAPFLERGYVQRCLVRNLETLRKPCWALLSMSDEAQIKQATQLEGRRWTQDEQEAAMKVAANEVGWKNCRGNGLVCVESLP